MSSPPVLLVVSSSLQAKFPALPHVMDLVTSFLLPPTIDSAVYNRLQRVLNVYEAFRPYSVRAMDGAAARGQLELVQWLHSNRSEGCSNAAFLSAVVNRHLNVLEWLYDFYPQVANPAQEIVKAAEYGLISELFFLQPKVRREQVEPALEAAAANGHVAVFEALLNRPFSIRKSFLAATENGHAHLVQFLLDKGYNDQYAYVNPGLAMAAERGHCNVVGLLVEKSDDYTIGDALMTAASDGRQEVVGFLLERCKLEKITVARAIEKAVKNDQCEVVKLLLEKFNREDDGNWINLAPTNMRSVNSIVDLAFVSAVENGRIDIVKVLADAFKSPMSDALISAGLSYQVEVLEFILDYCEARQLKGAEYNASIATVAEMAAWNRSSAVAKLLVAKCDMMNTGGALRIAVDNDDVEMLRIFIVKSDIVSIQEAVVRAAVTNRVEMLEVLLQYSNVDIVEQALIRVESVGNSTMSQFLLAKCDPGAYCRLFDNASRNGLVGLVQQLLGKMTGQSIRCGLISAAISGHTEVVKLLMEESDSIGLTCAFEMAVVRSQLGVVELLRNRCDAASTNFAILAGDVDAVRLLQNKRARLE